MAQSSSLVTVHLILGTRLFSIQTDRNESAELFAMQVFSIVGGSETHAQCMYLVNSVGKTLSLEDPDILSELHQQEFWFIRHGSRPLFQQLPNWDIPADPICSKVLMGTHEIVQPAFRAPLRGVNLPICAGCAQTCIPQHQVEPLDMSTLDSLEGGFVTDVQIILGNQSVSPPPGFQKIPIDLNIARGGTYVFLCFKKGRGAPVTHVDILEATDGISSSSSSTSSSPYFAYEGGLSDYEMTRKICEDEYSSRSVKLVAIKRASFDEIRLCRGIAIADMRIQVSSGEEESYTKRFNGDGMWVCHPTALSERSIDTLRGARRVHLWLQLKRIGSFSCSDHGECLFSGRVKTAELSTSNTANSSTEDLARRDQFSLAVYSQYLENVQVVRSAKYADQMPIMRRTLESRAQQVFMYEDTALQSEARSVIPVLELERRARENRNGRHPFREELLLQLLHWFKKEFFTWVDNAPCERCNCKDTVRVQSGPPSSEELRWMGNRVEAYRCPHCAHTTRFVRYNHPGKLLETRRGRCGEWANCFTLCCRALGFEARYVLDFTDHVWTEVYSDELQRWLHCDSCEDQLDGPLTYEAGWGKKLSYVFAFSKDEVVDVARRYSKQWNETLDRRDHVSEDWLRTTVLEFDARQRQLSRVDSDRLAVLTNRKVQEEQELDGYARFPWKRALGETETIGRISGSAEWRASRDETGDQQENLSTPCTPQQDGGTSAGFRRPRYPSKDQILSLLFNQLAAGCSSIGEKCPNIPYCAKAKDMSDMNANAAFAIETVSALSKEVDSPQQHRVSYGALTSLLCSESDQALEMIIRALHPVLYWPMQDSMDLSDDPCARLDSQCKILDVSGSRNDGSAELCALQRPFDLNRMLVASAIELYPRSVLKGSVRCNSGCEPHFFTALMLLRVDKVCAVGDEIPLFSMHAFGSQIKVQCASNGDLSCVLNGKKTNLAALRIRICQYYCLAVEVGPKSARIVLNSESHTISYTNHSLRGSHGTGEDEGSTVVQLGDRKGHSEWFQWSVSHFAVLPTVLREIEMKSITEAGLCPPKLQATPVCGGGDIKYSKECREPVAQIGSGFRVSKLKVWSGGFVEGIQLVYCGEREGSHREEYGELIKGNRLESRNLREFALLEGEFVTEVGGRSGAWMDQVWFRTNFGRRFECGGSGGTAFSLDIPVGFEMRGLFGKAGDFVDNIAVWMAPCSSVHRGEIFMVLESISDVTEAVSAANALTRYITNIIQSPNDQKFRSIRVQNKFFQSNVASLSQCHELLETLGFQLILKPDGDGNGNGTQVNSSDKEETIRLLRSAPQNLYYILPRGNGPEQTHLHHLNYSLLQIKLFLKHH